MDEREAAQKRDNLCTVMAKAKKASIEAFDNFLADVNRNCEDDAKRIFGQVALFPGATTALSLRSTSP